MKQQVVFIHGGEAYSEYKAYLEHLRTVEIENPFEPTEDIKKWKYALPEALGEGYEIAYPQMPSPKNAKYEEWKIWFERHFEFLRDGVILIGHSQGGYFLAKYLSENKMPLTTKALFLVAAPFAPADFGGEDGGDFSFDSKQLVNLEEQAKEIVIYHSKDDPIVPFSHGEEYQQALKKAEFTTFEDKGHFLMEEFPEIVERIKRM